MTRPTWESHFLNMAALAATRSKDRSTQVGAVIVDVLRQVVSTGYNGFPRGINDDIESRHERPLKYLWTCHAEENSILSAARRGVRVEGCEIYVTHKPCARCARMIVQAGIVRVTVPVSGDVPTMVDELRVGREILEEAGVLIGEV
jgi:dCMP deaminase